jgi:hypothetical protein
MWGCLALAGALEKLSKRGAMKARIKLAAAFFLCAHFYLVHPLAERNAIHPAPCKSLAPFYALSENFLFQAPTTAPRASIRHCGAGQTSARA